MHLLITFIGGSRPKTIEEISSQGDVVAVLRAALSSTTAHSNVICFCYLLIVN